MGALSFRRYLAQFVDPFSTKQEALGYPSCRPGKPLMLDPSGGTGRAADSGLIRSPGDPCKIPLQQPGFNRPFSKPVFLSSVRKRIILTIVFVFTDGRHSQFSCHKKLLQKECQFRVEKDASIFEHHCYREANAASFSLINRRLINTSIAIGCFFRIFKIIATSGCL
jgi:hypothetical protein